MPHHRHHIHLICDSKDTSLYPLLDAIILYFERHVHISKDLFLVGSDSANYSWRCINDCDCVFMLIGQSYGELNNTGVSQLHISYLNAKTKNKPIVAFITDDSDRPRALNDLIQIVKEQVSEIFYITKTTEYKGLFGRIYDIFDATFMPNILPTPITTTAANIAPDLLSSLGFETVIKRTNKPAPNLQDEVLLNCTAHAFFGGTLIEVSFMATTTWHTILSSLNKTLAFNSQGLWRLLNELVTPQAMPTIQISRPDVHAVSRCQVAQSDVLWVQEQLHTSGWIAPRTLPSTGKPTWRISDTAKKALSIF